jgi:hypothetical protein
VISSTETSRASVLDRLAVARDTIRTRTPWSLWAISVLGVATFAARAPGLVFNGMFDRDESYLAVTGDVLRHGGLLYVDVIDRKPPIAPMIYGLAREWSVDMRAIRVLCAVLIFLNGLVIAELIRRLTDSRRAALFGAVLAIIGTAMFLPPDAQAANFELWGLFPASAAILCVVVARRAQVVDARRAQVGVARRAQVGVARRAQVGVARRAQVGVARRAHVVVSRRARVGVVWWYAAAGALVVLAANCKQPYIVVGIPVLFEALRRSGDRWRAVAATAAGAVAAFVPFLFLFDGSRMIRWAWADNGDYLDGGLSLGRASLIGVGLTVAFVAFHLPLFYGVWAAITRRVRIDALIIVWAIVSIAVVPIGFRFFGHYYQQVVPPLAVMSGIAVVDASRRVWQTLALMTVALAVVLTSLAFVHRPGLSNFTALGRYVQRTTTPDQRILVWGALPDVYVASQRMPAGVFLHDGYLTGNWASRAEPLPASTIADEPFRSRWAMFFADLSTHPPELVIDAARPGTDWSAYGPEKYPIGAWLDRCYTRETVIDGLPVWRRDPNLCPG